jgi:histone-binding protein RBBP4
MTTSEENMRPEDDAHRKWKQCATPMYDFMTNHHLIWPALACRFGERTEAPGDAAKYEQTIFYSEQVDKDEKTPNKLIMQTVNIHKASYAPVDHINNWKENQKSPYFSKSAKHVIHHPGECNKIRDIRQHPHMVVTHSDVAEVYLWDFSKQPDNNTGTTGKSKKLVRNVPDLKLVGHKEMAPFALSTSTASPSVASGGEDAVVLVWDLEDQGEGSELNRSRAQLDTLEPRVKLTGHKAMVSDVCFKPGSDVMLATSADDHVIKVWDVRERSCVQDVQQVRQEDVLALDWSHDGLFLATGDNKGWMDIYDIRKLSENVVQPMFTFSQASPRPKAVIAVTWNPLQPSWVACGGEDGRVSVYDTSRPDKATADTLPAQLVLQHIGHLGSIMDAQWSPHDPFLMMSVSNDGITYKEGGACQLWRLSWLLHCDLEQAESKLKSYQKWLETGQLSDLPDVVSVDGSTGQVRPAKTPERQPAAAAERGPEEAAGAGVAGNGQAAPSAPLGESGPETAAAEGVPGNVGGPISASDLVQAEEPQDMQEDGVDQENAMVT